MQSKIISLDEIKKQNAKNKNENYQCTMFEISEVMELLENEEFRFAIIKSEELLDKYNFSEEASLLFMAVIAEYSDIKPSKITKFLEPLNLALENNKNSLEVSSAYCSLLISSFEYANDEDNALIFKKIKAVYEKWNDNEEIALLYAVAVLFKNIKLVLNESQVDFDKLKEDFVELDKLSTNFPENDEILVLYANFSFLIIDTFNGSDISEKAFLKLKSLHSNSKEDYEIASFYAQALSLACIETPFEECKTELFALKKIYENFDYEFEFLELYSISILGICIVQDLKQSRPLIQELEKIMRKMDDQNIDLSFIYQIYVEILTNFSADNIAAYIIEGELVRKIEKIVQLSDYDEEITLQYAKALYNLICTSEHYCDDKDSISGRAMRKLKGLGVFNNNTTAYYALAKSNLIHLLSKEEAFLVVEEVTALCNNVTFETMPITIDGIALTTCLIITKVAYVSLLLNNPSEEFRKSFFSIYKELINKNMLSFKKYNKFKMSFISDGDLENPEIKKEVDDIETLLGF